MAELPVPHPWCLRVGPGLPSPPDSKFRATNFNPFERPTVRTQYHIINYLQRYRSRATISRDTWVQTCPGPSPTRIHRDFAAFLLPLLFTGSCFQLLAFVSPCFQPLAHSFIFWITAIPRTSRSLRALPQKTGGTPLRGHTTPHPSWSKGSPAAASAEAGYPLYPLHTNTNLVCPLFPLLTQKRGSVPPRKKCRRADIFDFSPYFSHFLAQRVREGACPERSRRVAGH